MAKMTTVMTLIVVVKIIFDNNGAGKRKGEKTVTIMPGVKTVKPI